MGAGILCGLNVADVGAAALDFNPETIAGRRN